MAKDAVGYALTALNRLASSEVLDKIGMRKTVEALSRLDTAAEVEYYKNGGILHYVLRQMM